MSETRPCSKCRQLIEANAQRCPECGAVQPGNTLAMKSGVWATVPPAHLRQSADDMLAGLVADLGGESELTTLQRAYAVKLRDLEVIARGLAADLATRGLVTPGGTPRASVDKLLAVLRTWDSLAQRLGIERRPKRLDTLEGYLAQKTQAAGDGDGNDFTNRNDGEAEG